MKTSYLAITALLLGIASVVGCGDDTSDGGGQGGGGGGDGYAFANDDYSAYQQIDRHGAVEAGTVGIAATAGLFGDTSPRTAYNEANPEVDASGEFVDEITASLTALHGALDDDLEGAGLTPATLEESLAQAGPVIVPDTIKYDPNQPTSYPNGRRLTDQVVDITIAAALLKLSEEQPLTVLADLPLNPVENDVPFKNEFPYLADPH